MFQNIDEHVNAALANQGTPAPTTAPIEPTTREAEITETPIPATEAELLRAENERLKAEVSALAQQHESDLAAERLKVAAAQAHKPAINLSLGQQDIALQQAVRAVGGNVFWHRLSIQQKADALNVGAFASVPVKELKKYFGVESSAAEAMRLSNQQPDLYKQYRLLSKIHGLIG